MATNHYNCSVSYVSFSWRMERRHVYTHSMAYRSHSSLTLSTALNAIHHRGYRASPATLSGITHSYYAPIRGLFIYATELCVFHHGTTAPVDMRMQLLLQGKAEVLVSNQLAIDPNARSCLFFSNLCMLVSSGTNTWCVRLDENFASGQNLWDFKVVVLLTFVGFSLAFVASALLHAVIQLHACLSCLKSSPGHTPATILLTRRINEHA